MTFTTDDLQSIAEMERGVIAMEIDEIEDYGDLDELDRGPVRGIRRVARRVAPPGGTVASALAVSAAGIGSILVTSALHRGSTWAGLNTIPSGLGLVGLRPRSRFDARLAAIGIGAVVGSSLVVAALVNKLTPNSRIGRIGGGTMTAIGHFAADRFVMRRTFLPALTRALSPLGVALTYAAMSVASMRVRSSAPEARAR